MFADGQRCRAAPAVVCRIALSSSSGTRSTWKESVHAKISDPCRVTADGPVYRKHDYRVTACLSYPEHGAGAGLIAQGQQDVSPVGIYLTCALSACGERGSSTESRKHVAG